MGFSCSSQFCKLHKASHRESQLLETPWITSWLRGTLVPPSTAYSVKGWVPFLCVLLFHAAREVETFQVIMCMCPMNSAGRYYVLIVCCFRAKQAHWEAGSFMIFVELHFPRSRVQQGKKKTKKHKPDLKPFLHKIRNISDTLFNDNIQLFLFHLYFPSKVQLIGSLCSRNMKDDEDMEFWLSSLGTQPPLAQPSSPPPLSLLSLPPPALLPPTVDLFLLPGNGSTGNVTQDCLLQLQRNKQDGKNSRCYIRTVMYKCTKAM